MVLKKKERQPVSNDGGFASEDFLSNIDRWGIPSDLLTLDIEEEPDETIDKKKIVWTQYKNSTPKETELEAKEKKEAIDEQVKLGILRIRNNNQQQKIPNLNKPQKVSSTIMNLANNGVPQKTNQTQKKKKIGPNEPCPCGSGKKYKKCHGRGV